MKNLLLIYLPISLCLTACTFAPPPSKANTTEIEGQDKSTIEATQLEVEELLKTQLNQYLVAFTEGDTKTVLSMLYPDLFIWLSKTAEKYGETFSKDDVKEMFAQDLSKFKDLQSQGVDFSWSLEPITKKVETDDYLIYISVTALIGKMGYDEIKMGDETICISIDRGKTWKFLNNDPESVEAVLRISMPENIVQQIIN